MVLAMTIIAQTRLGGVHLGLTLALCAACAINCAVLFGSWF